MNKKKYFGNCVTFRTVLLDLACGEVVLCTPDYLELLVKDCDGSPHKVLLDKRIIKLLAIILTDYLKSL